MKTSLCTKCGRKLYYTDQPGLCADCQPTPEAVALPMPDPKVVPLPTRAEWVSRGYPPENYEKFIVNATAEARERGLMAAVVEMPPGPPKVIALSAGPVKAQAAPLDDPEADALIDAAMARRPTPPRRPVAKKPAPKKR